MGKLSLCYKVFAISTSRIEMRHRQVLNDFFEWALSSNYTVRRSAWTPWVLLLGTGWRLSRGVYAEAWRSKNGFCPICEEWTRDRIWHVANPSSIVLKVDRFNRRVHLLRVRPPPPIGLFQFRFCNFLWRAGRWGGRCGGDLSALQSTQSFGIACLFPSFSLICENDKCGSIWYAASIGQYYSPNRCTVVMYDNCAG